MTFPRYADYKDSGIEWLGEVPAHWEVVSIKRLSPVLRGASPRPIENPKYFDDNGIYGWVRISDVSSSNGYLRETPDILSELGASLSVKIEPGTLFISIAGSVGKPCISARKICIHDGFVYFPLLNMNPIFIFRIFETGECYAGLGKMGTQLNLNTDTIGSIKIAAPPPSEIEIITAFLDHETGKIDALVAEQEKLIALLKEKRQAVISHAVTKGLDPSVPLKDSGIEWLGDVPEHWEVKRIKHVVPHIGQGWSPEAFDRLAEGNEWGVLKSSCVNHGIFRDTEHKTLPPGVTPPEGLEVLSGDVLMSRASGSLDLIGSAALVENCSFRLIMSDKIFRLEVDQKICFKPFLVKMLGSPTLRTQITQAISGAEGLANNIGKGAIREFWLPLPPLPEQTAIVAYLDAQTAKFDTLTAEAERAIALLKERRSALISAAVTGKIDVRGFVAPTPQEAA